MKSFKPSFALLATCATLSACATTGPGAHSPAADRIPERLQALGTEPFWNVTVDGSGLRYSTPVDQAGQAISAARQDGRSGSRWTGTVNGQPFELSIAPGRCSDGMSDRVYSYSAVLRLGSSRHSGCARVLPAVD